MPRGPPCRVCKDHKNGYCMQGVSKNNQKQPKKVCPSKVGLPCFKPDFGG